MSGLLSDRPAPGDVRLLLGMLLLAEVQIGLAALAPALLAGAPLLLMRLTAILCLASLLPAIAGERAGQSVNPGDDHHVS
jgi:hypothetical protein